MNTSRSAEEGKVNQGKDGQSTSKKKEEYRMALYTVVGDDHVLDISAR